jgi:hypothetical protein
MQVKEHAGKEQAGKEHAGERSTHISDDISFERVSHSRTSSIVDLIPEFLETMKMNSLPLKMDKFDRDAKDYSM